MSYFNEMTEEEKALDKKLRRENIIEFICAIIAIPLILLSGYLFLLITPDQFSAECEYQRQQMMKHMESCN